MKIALCLSGQMRAMEHCIDTVNVAFPQADIDVYATVWEHEDQYNIDLLKYKMNVSYINKVTNKDLILDEEFEKQVIKAGFYNQFHIKNWAPVPVWNLQRLENMAKFSFIPVVKDDYDFVVRSRYDTKYLQNLIPLLDKTKLLVSEDIGGSAPWDNWKDTRMVYDGFAAGSYEMMLEYYQFSKWLSNYFYYHRETLKAERTLGWYLEEIAALPMKFARNILGLQVNDKEWYNRNNPIQTMSLNNKQKDTFKFYKDDLKLNHPGLYDEVSACFD